MYPFFLLLALLVSLQSLRATEPTQASEVIVKREIELFMQEHSIPGVAVALVFNGKSYLYQFGYADLSSRQPVTANTIFELASLTKVFTSTALALEILRNNMNLNDSVTKYIPQLQSTKNPISQVSLVDLATHTSSLPRVPPQKPQKYTEATLISFLNSWKPTYPIGTKFVYSNLGFGLIGLAISNVEQTNYENMIEKLITKPLQMGSTFVQVPEYLFSYYAQGYDIQGRIAPQYELNAWPGGGSLRSSSSDMLKFLEANLGLDGPIELIKAMELAQAGYFTVKKNFVMGLGWQRLTSDGLLIIDKNGGVPGFSTYIGLLPQQKIGIVILTNKAKTHVTRKGRQILKRLSNL